MNQKTIQLTEEELSHYVEALKEYAPQNSIAAFYLLRINLQETHEGKVEIVSELIEMGDRVQKAMRPVLKEIARIFEEVSQYDSS